MAEPVAQETIFAARAGNHETIYMAPEVEAYLVCTDYGVARARCLLRNFGELVSLVCQPPRATIALESSRCRIAPKLGLLDVILSPPR